ncbi:MAG: hypothetical protein M3P18_17915, partial [Actinomycetota bacterium]|nr:hypothetical protein [Actinomycetota bacterium]
TESLDPIKAYECLSIDTPTVATPVAGFRDYPVALNIAERDMFAARIADVLKSDVVGEGCEPPGWEERAVAFEDVLWRASGLGERS